MTASERGRPQADEQIPYFQQYIDLVEGDDVVAALDGQIEPTVRFFGAFSDEQARLRPEPAEWSIAEIVGHLIDTERVLAYRALRIARAETTLWESVDFDAYVEHSGFRERSMPSLLDEIVSVRQATLAMFTGFGPEAWSRRMPEEWSLRSVRSIAWVIAGHEIFHLSDVRARW